MCKPLQRQQQQQQKLCVFRVGTSRARRVRVPGSFCVACAAAAGVRRGAGSKQHVVAIASAAVAAAAAARAVACGRLAGRGAERGSGSLPAASGSPLFGSPGCARARGRRAGQGEARQGSAHGRTFAEPKKGFNSIK